jgi:sterol carrier protein 2
MANRVNILGVGMIKFSKPGESDDYHVMAAGGGGRGPEGASI